MFLFVLHGTEEYFTGFYNVDGLFLWIMRPFQGLASLDVLFLLFQIIFWLLLGLVFITKMYGRLSIIVLLTLIFVFELHHILRTVFLRAYYPGTITSLFFPVIGFLMWKAFLKARRAPA